MLLATTARRVGRHQSTAVVSPAMMRGCSQMSTPPAPIVFLLDCDNTLLDNDAVKADLDAKLGALLGDARNKEFWDLYETVRQETELVNYPVVLERFAARYPDEATIARARSIIMDYPFASRLYPDTLPTLSYLRDLGKPAILSDGDPIYQPLKITNSGLAAAVEDRVLVYVHKEDHLDEVMRTWPAEFYVAVDDKARILAEIKERRPDRFVTVHVRQGHYGAVVGVYSPPPDLSLAGIGDLRGYGADDYRRLLRRSAAPFGT